METIKIRTKTNIDALAVVLLLVVYCEFLHVFNNAVITAGLAAAGIFLNLCKGMKYHWHDVLCVLIAVIAGLYSRSDEGIRYFLLLIAWITWEKLHFRNLMGFVHLLVIVMALCAIPQKMQGMERITGFYLESPTQPACVLLICESYMMICMANTGIDKKSLLLSVLSILLILWTGTRSNFLASVLVFGFFGLRILVNCGRISNKNAVFWFTLLTLSVVALLFLPFLISVILSKLNRSNAADSTNTRMYIYQSLFREIFRSPESFLIGSKGGFVEIHLKQLLNVTEYFPGHQDYIVILCEYGLIGLITVFVAFLRKHSCWLYFIMLFTVCSFHNIMLASTSMMLMLITMTDMERKGYTFWGNR